MDITEVANLAKKHSIHSGEVSWPDDYLEQLHTFANEIVAMSNTKKENDVPIDKTAL